MFLMWLGEQVTSRASATASRSSSWRLSSPSCRPRSPAPSRLSRQGRLSVGILLLVAIMVVAVIAFIVFMERPAPAPDPVSQAPGRQPHVRGQSSHLPLKLNTSGVIPPIFASSLLLLPTTVANFNSGQLPEWRIPSSPSCRTAGRCFWSCNVALIVFFAFFYTAIVFNPTETADNLKKHGGFNPRHPAGRAHRRIYRLCASRIT